MGRLKMSVEQRLLKIFERCIENKETGCLIWTGCCTKKTIRNKQQYGHISIFPFNILVHKYVYENTVGIIPKGLVLDHIVCNNGLCVNVKHMKPVTNRMNILRGNSIFAINARKTHCIHGHEFIKENIYYDGTGRKCRKCINLAAKRYRERRNNNGR